MSAPYAILAVNKYGKPVAGQTLSVRRQGSATEIVSAVTSAFGVAAFSSLGDGAYTVVGSRGDGAASLPYFNVLTFNSLGQLTPDLAPILPGIVSNAAASLGAIEAATIKVTGVSSFGLLQSAGITAAYASFPFAAGVGITAHGSLTGLSGDDHTQYALVTGSRTLTLLQVTGTASFGLLRSAGITATYASFPITHAGLPGLANDEHTQYALTSGSRAFSLLSVTGAASFGAVRATNASFPFNTGVIAHGSITALDGDHHTQYALATGSRAFSSLLVTGTASFNLLQSAGITAAYASFPLTMNAGVTAHGSLTGLDGDDHTQYVLATGSRSMTILQVTGNASIGTARIGSEIVGTASIGNLRWGGIGYGANLSVDGASSLSALRADNAMVAGVASFSTLRAAGIIALGTGSFSNIVTGSLTYPAPVTIEATVLNPTGSLYYVINRTRHDMTLQKVYAMTGISGAAYFNVIRSQATGSPCLASSYLVATPGAWWDAGNIADTGFTAGNSIHVTMGSFTGSPTYAGIQLEFIRTV